MTDFRTFIVQRLCTKHDTNGNPRRVFVFSELVVYPGDDDRCEYYGTDGFTHIVFTHDEGYGSLRVAMEQFRASGLVGPCVNHGDVVTDVSTYRRLVKWAPITES